MLVHGHRNSQTLRSRVIYLIVQLIVGVFPLTSSLQVSENGAVGSQPISPTPSQSQSSSMLSPPSSSPSTPPEELPEASFEAVMAFDGPAPEAINGRLVSLFFACCGSPYSHGCDMPK